jgi:hypothetical protein
MLIKFDEWKNQQETVQANQASWGVEVSGSVLEIIKYLQDGLTKHAFPATSNCIISVEFQNPNVTQSPNAVNNSATQ